LPKTRSADIIARQIIRLATSIGANYRAACRAKSTPDMLNKLKIVEEESDETIYWLELLQEIDYRTVLTK
jgi:four helix bundle protein